MKKIFTIICLVTFLSIFRQEAKSQCSVCTRTAQQMGEKPAKGLNAGILYLALTPLALIGFITYKWWNKNKSNR